MNSDTSISRQRLHPPRGSTRAFRALLAFALVLALRLLLLATPALAVESGTLSQLPAPFECVGEEREPSALCGTRVPYGLNAAYELQMSPDGKSAYSVAVGKPSNQGAVVEYSRDPATGALTVRGCLTSEASPACAAEGSETGIAALEDPAAVAVSPDGASVYVVGQGENTLVEFARDPQTGLLTKSGCITAQATSTECATTEAHGLSLPYGVAVSPDGKNVYVTSLGEEAVAEFSRETGTGALTAIAGSECIGAAGSGCPTKSAIGLDSAIGVVVSPDGKDLYVAAGAKDAESDIAVFERDETSGALKQLAGEEGCIGDNHTKVGCAEDATIESTEALAISPDGKNIYANAYAKNAVVELQREADGSLTALGGGNACVTTETIAGCKTVGTLLASPLGVAVSPGTGEDVYVTSNGDSAVVELARDPATGALELLSEGEGCVTTEFSGCGVNGLVGLTGARRLIVSPDGTNVYVAAQGGNAFAELARTVTPTVSSIAPAQGSEAGGTTVTIEGSGFREGVRVQFAGKEASQVEVQSATRLIALTPPGEGAGVAVRVLNAAGAGGNQTYEYIPGGLNIAGYCEGLGYPGTGEAGATLLLRGGVEGPEFAYRNWACVEAGGGVVALTNKGAPPSFADACHAAYGSSLPFAYPGETGNAYSWGCHASADPSLEAEPEAEARISSNKSSTPESIIGGGGASPLAPAVPAPVLAVTGNVAPVSGTVMVRLPGTKAFVALASLRQIPFGTVIEATNGRVSITTAIPNGGTQVGELFGGEFILRQGRNGVVVLELTGGNFAVCPTARERSHVARVSDAHARAATSGSHVVRKLWANAHGKFSTKGNYAAGAVQGTEWLTEDLCDGTLIRVTRDKVAVTNLVNHRHVEVKTGHKYLAKAP